MPTEKFNGSLSFLEQDFFFAPAVNFSVECLINVIVTDFVHLCHCFCEIVLQQKENNALLYFILKHFDPWSKVYTYNFRTRNHCRLTEWIIIMDYSLYSHSNKRSIICTLDLKHWSPNLFLYFPNNGLLSIMIIYLSQKCKTSQNPHLSFCNSLHE